ncbi:MAG: DNA primase [Chloroflexi bacterium]|nr:DNA primase [Chloroflexota bacterium]
MAGEIDEIKARLSIEGLVGRHVQLQRSGQHLRGRCPFHDERTPSFFVFLDSGNYKCFGCGEAGDAFTFLMKMENLTFREALVRLAEETGVRLAPRGGNPARREYINSLIGAVEAASHHYEQQLQQHRHGQSARDYLRRRGIGSEIQTRFRLGLAPESWDGLLSALTGQGIAPQTLLAAGLVRQGQRESLYDAFRARLMFPIRAANGAVRGFGGRTLGDDPAKYINTGSTEIFDKSRLLYGLDLAQAALRRQRQAVVVEGYTDVIAAHAAGFENVVAAMGTTLTEPQFRMVAKSVDQIVICMDGDAAGRAAGRRNLERMDQFLGPLVWHEGQLRAEIKIAPMPQGQDPDEVIRTDRQRWQSLLADAVPLSEYLFGEIVAAADTNTRRGRAQALQEALKYLRRLARGDPVTRSDYIATLAERLQIPVPAIEAELRRRPDDGPAPEFGAPASAHDPVAMPAEDRLCALAMRNPALLRQAVGRAGLPLAVFEGAAARSVFEILSRLHSSEPANDHLGRQLGEQDREYLDRLDRINSARPEAETEQQLYADIAGLVLRLRESWLAAEAERTSLVLDSESDRQVRRQALAAMNDLNRQRLEIDQQRNRLSIST